MIRIFNKIGLQAIHGNAKQIFLDSITGLSAELAQNISKDATFELFWANVIEGAKLSFLAILGKTLALEKSYNPILSKTSNFVKSGGFLAVNSSMTVKVLACGINDFTDFSLVQLSFLSQGSPVDVALSISSSDSSINHQETINISGRTIVELDPALTICADEDNTDLFFEITFTPTSPIELQPFEVMSTDAFLTIEPPTFAVRPKAELTYNLDRLVDSMERDKTLQAAVSYVVAAQILDEKLASYRLNLFTNTRREDTQIRRDEYLRTAETFLKSIRNALLEKLKTEPAPVSQADNLRYSGGSYV